MKKQASRAARVSLPFLLFPFAFAGTIVVPGYRIVVHNIFFLITRTYYVVIYLHHTRRYRKIIMTVRTSKVCTYSTQVPRGVGILLTTRYVRYSRYVQYLVRVPYGSK